MQISTSQYRQWPREVQKGDITIQKRGETASMLGHPAALNLQRKLSPPTALQRFVTNGQAPRCPRYPGCSACSYSPPSWSLFWVSSLVLWTRSASFSRKLVSPPLLLAPSPPCEPLPGDHVCREVALAPSSPLKIEKSQR